MTAMPKPTVKSGKPPAVLVWGGGFAPIGGIETFIADLSRSAVGAGFQVDLLAWDRRSKLLKAMSEAGVRVHCSTWRWGCRWGLPDWFLLPFGLWRCRRASVIVFGKTVGYAAHDLIQRFGRRRGGRQRFIYVTPYRPAELWGKAPVESEKKKIAGLLGTFDVIICQSWVFAEDLRSLGYHGQLEILPYLPPNAAEIPAPYPDGPLVIGFLGRLEHQKNLAQLLEVFALLLAEAASRPEKKRPLRLRLIGEGSLRAELMSRARELGIEHAVDFQGAVPRERIRAVIQSCQLFCFTSHTEGQPLASLEILAEGRPIIATAVGAFPNMLSNPAMGETVPRNDTPAFLSAVTKMLAHQESGLITPSDTVAAYDAKFNRKDVVRRYLELLSTD